MPLSVQSDISKRTARFQELIYCSTCNKVLPVVVQELNTIRLHSLKYTDQNQIAGTKPENMTLLIHIRPPCRYTTCHSSKLVMLCPDAVKEALYQRVQSAAVVRDEFRGGEALCY